MHGEKEQIVFDLIKIKQAIIRGKPDDARDSAQKALLKGREADRILNEALIPAMDEVGKKFGRNEIFFPEMLVAAMPMKQALATLKPVLVSKGIKGIGTVVLGTVQGDLHDIGKNLVGMLLEGAGFEVIDLGIDTPKEEFIKAVRENAPQLLGLSALLTTTMPRMKEVIDELEKDELRGKVRVIIGGAPVTQEYADEIGADGYAPDAASAAMKAKDIVGVNSL
jgi:5-methyltetrahydrofolate--homocysteine methyltransferase